MVAPVQTPDDATIRSRPLPFRVAVSSHTTVTRPPATPAPGTWPPLADDGRPWLTVTLGETPKSVPVFNTLMANVAPPSCEAASATAPPTDPAMYTPPKVPPPATKLADGS